MKPSWTKVDKKKPCEIFESEIIISFLYNELGRRSVVPTFVIAGVTVVTRDARHRWSSAVGAFASRMGSVTVISTPRVSGLGDIRLVCRKIKKRLTLVVTRKLVLCRTAATCRARAWLSRKWRLQHSLLPFQ